MSYNREARRAAPTYVVDAREMGFGGLFETTPSCKRAALNRGPNCICPSTEAMQAAAAENAKISRPADEIARGAVLKEVA